MKFMSTLQNVAWTMSFDSVAFLAFAKANRLKYHLTTIGKNDCISFLHVDKLILDFRAFEKENADAEVDEACGSSVSDSNA